MLGGVGTGREKPLATRLGHRLFWPFPLPHRYLY